MLRILSRLQTRLSKQSSSTLSRLQTHLPQPLLHLLRFTRTHRRDIAFFLRTSAFCFPAIIAFHDYIATTTWIEGCSMQPTLSPTYHETQHQDLVLWRTWEPANKDLKRGDVVQFMKPFDPEGFAVKRVVALEGDTVVLDRRRRPKENLSPSASAPSAARAWDSWQGRVTVPQGHVWVEGDNWRKSLDSNDYGPISRSLIVGRAVVMLGRRSERAWGEGMWEWHFTKPWRGWRGMTKVVEAVKGRESRHWTQEGLPVELAEIGEPLLPPRG